MPRPPAAVMTALENALAQAPDDLAMRNHVAQMLLDDERAEEALELCKGTLGKDPGNIDALQLAARLARQLQRPNADGYERLLTALLGPAAGQALSGSARPGAPSAGVVSERSGAAVKDEAAAAPPPAANAAAAVGPASPGLRAVGPAPAASAPGAPTDGATLVAGERPGLRLAAERGEVVDEFELEAPRVSFADVGGMLEVKKKLELSVLGPLRNPQLYKAFGKTATGGLLLYGPPGCGKTYLARALAGEMGARFATIGLEDVLNMWFGESEQRLHKVFDTARRRAPMVLFFDELDAIGHKRSELRGGAGRNLVNMLLSEMDGAQHDNTNVFILGATNHPWDIDSALRRPGRFDRTVLVLPPDEPARESIIKYHLSGCPHKAINTAELAKATALFSGADLAQLCNLARESAIESSAAAGALRPVGMDDFKRALRSQRPSTIEWFGQARNFAMFANESGVYDDLLEYMRRNKLG